jgi:hypothetical protein
LVLRSSVRVRRAWPLETAIWITDIRAASRCVNFPLTQERTMSDYGSASRYWQARPTTPPHVETAGPEVSGDT